MTGFDHAALFSAAEASVRADETCSCPVTPMRALRAFARARHPYADDVTTWHPLAIAGTLEDLWREVGHYCDRHGVDYVAACAVALGCGFADVTILDGETDEIVTSASLAPRDVLRENDAFADRIEDVMPGKADVARVGRDLRHVKTMCEDVGIDVDDLALRAMGGWSAERRDPELERDAVVILGRCAPRT